MARKLRALRNLKYPIGESLKAALAAGGLSKLTAERFEAATGSTMGRLAELSYASTRGYLPAQGVVELETLTAAMQEVRDSIEYRSAAAGDFCEDIPPSSVPALIASGKAEFVTAKKKAKKKGGT